MTFNIVYTPSYNKLAAKFLKKHPDLYSQYDKTLKLLEVDPYHPSLRMHKLKGILSDIHSVSINMSYRITLEIIVYDNKLILVDVGHHDSIYR